MVTFPGTWAGRRLTAAGSPAVWTATAPQERSDLLLEAASLLSRRCADSGQILLGVESDQVVHPKVGVVQVLRLLA